MDFTFKAYEKLLKSLLARGFLFITFAQYMEDKAKAKESDSQQINNSITQIANKLTSQQTNKLTINRANKLIILRHDVEARYPNALRMAEIEHQLGIKGSYYFRIFTKPGNEEIIKQIAAMGHEIGYHYDDLTACKGNHKRALFRFQKNLSYLRQFAPVTTITMEGAPLSKYDNRDLWNRKKVQTAPKTSAMRSAPCLTPSQPHYTHFGILAEPYFDLNFNQICYLTDTGRRWDGHRYNVHDKATKENPVTNPAFLKLRFRTTHDLINAINSSPPNKLTSLYTSTFPNQAMLNFHPQRWNNKPFPWLKELIWQNVKNQGKRVLLQLRNGD